MAYEMVASGGVIDFPQLADYESYLAEGQRGMVELELRIPVKESVAREIEEKLRAAGVADVSVNTGSPILQIWFRKAFPWLAVIAAIILGAITLAILITGWKLFREIVPESVQLPVALLLISGIVLIGAALLRQRR